MKIRKLLTQVIHGREASLYTKKYIFCSVYPSMGQKRLAVDDKFLMEALLYMYLVLVFSKYLDIWHLF